MCHLPIWARVGILERVVHIPTTPDSGLSKFKEISYRMRQEIIQVLRVDSIMHEILFIQKIQ